jgi:hypothetical protein
MEADGVQPNEAALTSVARLAAATRDPAMDFANSLTELAIKREARDDFLGFQVPLQHFNPFSSSSSTTYNIYTPPFQRCKLVFLTEDLISAELAKSPWTI